MFNSTLFTIAKTWTPSKCPLTDDWTKMWYIYTMEYYLVTKRKKFCHLQQHGWNWSGVILSEVRESKTDIV